MSKPESTPDQALELYGAMQSVFHASRVEYPYRYHQVIDAIPDEVAQHLPATDENATLENTIHLNRFHDSHDGVVCIARFSQAEQIDSALSYQTNINYHIRATGKTTFGLERHVAHSEEGPHVEAERRMRVEQMLRDPAAAIAQEPNQQESKAARDMARSMGMFVVAFTEARQIITFVKDLKI